MRNPDTTISTHAPRQVLSRLTLYRLKRAKADYAMAATELEDQYNEKIRAILGNDRPATAALRNFESANWRYWPWSRRAGQRKEQPSLAIANTFDNQLTPYPGTPKPDWLVSIASLLRRHGYKQTVRVR